MDELKEILAQMEEGMKDSLSHLEKAFLQIRAGKANPSMLASVMVDYYGSPTPLSQVANVSTPDGMTISIQPWEKSLIPEIEKGIMVANLGFNPSNNGESVIINVPPLTEDRRKDLVKQAKAAAEKAKVSIRNWRKDGKDEIKKTDASEDMQKNAETDLQSLTDKYTQLAEQHLTKKEEEIMTI